MCLYQNQILPSTYLKNSTYYLEQHAYNNSILLDSSNICSICNTSNKIKKISKKGKKIIPKQFSGSWNFEKQVTKFTPTTFDFNTSQCGVNKDFIENLAVDFTELDIF